MTLEEIEEHGQDLRDHSRKVLSVLFYIIEFQSKVYIFLSMFVLFCING